MAALHQLAGFCLSPFGIWFPMLLIGVPVFLVADYLRWRRNH